MCQTEARKISAGLRDDDSQWTSLKEWEMTSTVLTGWAKAKGTEATSTRITERMPWAAPLRGVGPDPSNWAARIFETAAELGLRPGDGYAAPDCSNVRAGVTPPGAAMGDQHLTQLRMA